MKKYYTNRELIKFHESALLLLLNGLITDGELQKIKIKLLKFATKNQKG